MISRERQREILGKKYEVRETCPRCGKAVQVEIVPLKGISFHCEDCEMDFAACALCDLCDVDCSCHEDDAVCKENIYLSLLKRHTDAGRECNWGEFWDKIRPVLMMCDTKNSTPFDSQIYIRYNVANRNKTYKGLIARNYRDNGEESLVSSARYLINELQGYLVSKITFADKGYIDDLKRVCDTDFDKKKVLTGFDIIKNAVTKWGETLPLYRQDFSEIVFLERSGKNGKCFIDVTENGIKYCFTDATAEKPLDGEQYMTERREDLKQIFPYISDWDVPCKYMTEEEISYTKENIKKIKENATLMTTAELKAFVEGDYSYLYQ
jgi:hypothetical protein